MIERRLVGPCPTCNRYHPRMRWAPGYQPERVSWWRIAGMTAFCLAMFVAVFVALPILLVAAQ